ncbi:glucosamine kinase [Pseudorhodobacter antarcticus]|uniref:Glucosamine kinase n=1 Tax=Pseudorhodobacter antarcticus TaxID=1077947 RepID=A0A1H8FYN6_9RHOB|nr:BadF/BadG/BcrA/BcrD ATPase family protein [Pseudorhodobacter antarcticus]SEN36863.1 glucosamine kinase [Pseudorhodobacter antarcticus]
MTLIIACDGGGTGCHVVIADLAGRVLAQGAGGPANVTTDFDAALANLRAALAQAVAQSGGLDVSNAVAHFGLAGVTSAQMTQRVAQALPLRNICVTGDQGVALAGALGGGDGVLMALGTGTIIASTKGGQVMRIGGWGLQLSDQASGAWLGRCALEQTLRCHDGLDAFCDLTRDTFDEFQRDPLAMVAFAATAKPADYARFAPQVVQAAAAGTPGGVQLMQRGAAYLCRALGVLAFAPPDVLCLTGGVGPHYAPYLPKLVQAAITPAKGSGLDGALHLALARQRAQTNRPA